MAFPQVQSITETSFTGTPTAHLVNMPASVSPGDLLLILFANVAVNGYTTPTGWTVLDSLNRYAHYVKVSDGTEGGTTVDIVTSTGDNGCAQVYRISDWEGTLSSVEIGTVSTGLSTAPDPPSLTATWGAEDNLWIAMSTGVDDDAVFTVAPTNYTNLVSTQTGAGFNASSEIGSARRELNTATENPGVFTLNSGESWWANTIVIRPGAGGGTAYTIDAETGSISVTGNDTELKTSRTILSVIGNIITSGKTLFLKVARNLSAVTGNILTDGKNSNLTRGYSQTAETGNIIITGHSVVLKNAVIIIPETGSIIVTGYDANLGNQKNYVLSAETGSIIVDGKDISLLRQSGIIAETGSIIVTGKDVNLVFSGDDRVYYKVLVTNADITTTLETVADITTRLETKADITTELETNGDIG